MPDPLADQLGGDASGTPPVETAVDIEKIKADIAAEFDERFKGMQRLIAERETALKARDEELEELKIAGLTEEEREQFTESKKDRELKDLRMQLDLRDLEKVYGAEMPAYQKLLKAQSAEEQLETIREYAKSLAPTAPASTAGDPDIPEVDLNRPARQPLEGLTLPDGTVMTDALADQILAAGRPRGR